MSAATMITDLPEEILAKIFGYLNHESLLSACLVCKNWDEIISSSINFLDSSQLSIPINKKSNFKLSRKYRSLSLIPIDNCVLRKSYLDQIVNVTGSLTQVVIEQPSSIESRDFVVFMHLCRNLKDLEIHNLSQKHESREPINDKAKLEKLERLSLHSSDWLLRYLEVNKLKFVYIGRDMEQKNPSPQEHIVQFLNQLESLDTLILVSTDLKTEVELEPLFQWNHLKFFDAKSSMNEHMERNWQKLINAADTDSKVSLESFIDRRFIASLLEMIRTQKKITKIKLEISVYPLLFSDMKFDHIKTMKLRQPHSDSDEDDDDDFYIRRMVLFDDIVNYFPNVEYLDLDFNAALYVLSNDRAEIKMIFCKVKHLKVDSLLKCVQMCRSVVFPSIQTLEIAEGFFGDWATQFGRNNTTLRKLITNNGSSAILNTWRRYLEAYPSVEIFDVTDRSTGEKFLKTRNEVEQMLTTLN